MNPLSLFLLKLNEAMRRVPSGLARYSFERPAGSALLLLAAHVATQQELSPNLLRECAALGMSESEAARTARTLAVVAMRAATLAAQREVVK